MIITPSAKGAGIAIMDANIYRGKLEYLLNEDSIYIKTNTR